MRKKLLRAFSLAVVWTMASMGMSGARANSVTDFYRGKTISIVLPTGPGGTYAFYALLLGQYMPRHIPGAAAIIMENVPGAGGLKAANYLYNAAPKDGTAVGMLFQSVPMLQAFNPHEVKFDARKFIWLDAVDEVVNTIAVWHGSPALTIDQAKHVELVIGALGRDDATFSYPMLVNSVVGTKFKIVPGYASGANSSRRHGARRDQRLGRSVCRLGDRRAGLGSGQEDCASDSAWLA